MASPGGPSTTSRRHRCRSRPCPPTSRGRPQPGLGPSLRLRLAGAAVCCRASARAQPWSTRWACLVSCVPCCLVTGGDWLLMTGLANHDWEAVARWVLALPDRFDEPAGSLRLAVSVLCFLMLCFSLGALLVVRGDVRCWLWRLLPKVVFIPRCDVHCQVWWPLSSSLALISLGVGKHMWWALPGLISINAPGGYHHAWLSSTHLMVIARRGFPNPV